MENTCKTCINNDDGLCDRKGIIVEDEDFCEHHWAAGKKIRMKRHEKKMDITPELMLSAYNTLIQFCRGQPASEDGTTLRYPYLESNTIYYLRDGKVQQNIFARREDAERRFKEMKEGIR